MEVDKVLIILFGVKAQLTNLRALTPRLKTELFWTTEVIVALNFFLKNQYILTDLIKIQYLHKSLFQSATSILHAFFRSCSELLALQIVFHLNHLYRLKPTTYDLKNDAMVNENFKIVHCL